LNFRNLDYVKAYVDGSVIDNKWGGGFVIMDPNDKIIYMDCGIGEDNPDLNAMRNISGEMSAAMHATLWIDYYCGKGVIYHDYIGLSKWVTGEWSTNKTYTKIYSDFMRPFWTLDIISFQWVKGHTGNRGNEIADNLAKESILYNKHWKQF